MKTLKLCLLLAFATVSLTSLRAQTVDEIINKHIEAMGGKDKLAQLKSVKMDMRVEVMGNESPTTVTIVNGKGYRYEAEVNGQKIVQCYTDKGGWMINPMMGGTDPQPLSEEQYKGVEEQIYATGPLFDYAAKGNKVEFVGQEKVGDVSAYKLKVTNKDSAETTLYLDPSTYYIIQLERSQEMMGNPVTVIVKNSNFQKTDEGYVFPRTLETDFGEQFSLAATVNKIEVNPAIDPSTFDMPSK